MAFDFVYSPSRWMDHSLAAGGRECPEAVKVAPVLVAYLVQ